MAEGNDTGWEETNDGLAVVADGAGCLGTEGELAAADRLLETGWVTTPERAGDVIVLESCDCDIFGAAALAGTEGTESNDCYISG